jgi:hypothetical protein
MIRKAAPILLLAVLIPSLSQAGDDNVQWGSSDKAYRHPVDGMKGYYEPDKIGRKGDVVSFKVYRSANPSVPGLVGDYMVNCETREMVTVEDGKPTQPMKLLAGEQLYPISAKLCEWPDGKGYFKQFF